MFYKGIILDLDDTIYNYKNTHTISLTCVLNFMRERFNIIGIDLEKVYNTISTNLKYELNNTASSHNKSIYFKQLLEFLKLDISILYDINTLYWNTFFDNITLFDGVKDFLLWNKKLNIKIAILTDYECEYQIQKLNKLGITEYVDLIITSEEIGIEKPSFQMFQTIIRKLDLKSEEIIMIGDSFDKDIIGAINMSIFSFWYNNNKHCNTNYNNEKCIRFESFKELHNKFENIETELNKLKTMSRFSGERFDLVQAGGGNSSVKIENWMFIKASGINMTQINTNIGYVILDNNKLLTDISSDNTRDVIEYNVIGNKRASIETFMHSILKKYTLHLHPIQVNRILITKNCKHVIEDLFPDSLIIDYITPGIKLCNYIKNNYNNENIIFLINHGIIITSDTYEEIYDLLNDVINKFENIQNINFEKFKYTNLLSHFINNTFNLDNVSYLCQNNSIIEYFKNNKNLFKEGVAFPDSLIYCGFKPIFVNNLKEIKEFHEKYNELPKIIIVNDNIYINSISINKCREIEEVLLSNLMVLDSNYEKNYLSIEELCFLNNWDSEKYRKNI